MKIHLVLPKTVYIIVKRVHSMIKFKPAVQCAQCMYIFAGPAPTLLPNSCTLFWLVEQG